MASPKVLISGSGIAGSAFASCLLKAYRNAAITIVERAPAPRLTGASVDIRSNAVDIIKWMGIEQEIRDNGTGETGVEWIGKKGNVFAVAGATGQTNIQSMTSEYEIFRGALANILFTPIKDQVKLTFDETIQSFNQDSDGVEVTFSNGKAAEKYDLLVAADGVGSRIRGRITNANPRDHILDHGLHAAYFTVKKDMLDGSRFSQWYNSTRGRCIFLRPDPSPLGLTRANFVVRTTHKSEESLALRDRLNSAIKSGNTETMDLLEEIFRDAGWRAQEVIDGMRQSEDFYSSLFTRVSSPIYHDQRVVLLGDAAYATPGIGTSLAIIGGYVLAGELLRHGATKAQIPAASQAFSDIMMPFVRKQQNVPVDFVMGCMNPQTLTGISVRNAVLGSILNLKLDQLGFKIAGAMGYKEAGMTLPEYAWPTT